LNKLLFIFLLLTLLIGFGFFPNYLSAQGNLLIFPTRVVLDDTKKMDQLILSNTGNDTAHYFISFINLRMKTDGNVESITNPDSGQQFADKHLRFFPHAALLGPNETQLIKIQGYKMNELKPGEYRSHLYIRTEQSKTNLGKQESTEKDSGIWILIKPIFGFTIPVILRIGESNAIVSIEDLSFQLINQKEPSIVFELVRTGNSSSYGNITVNYLTGAGKETKVAYIKGIAIYTPNTLRKLRLLLDKDPSINYTHGSLQVIYEEENTDKKNGKITLVKKEMMLD